MAQDAGAGTPSIQLARRTVLQTFVRPLGVLALTLLVYSVVPIEGREAARVAVVTAALGILMILVVFGWQVSRVARSARPLLAALEALALVFGMFVCLFGLLYVALSEGDPTSFSQDITKVTGIYFTVTVLTTVGFGDIVATTELARSVVTIQMVLGMVLIGTAFKILSRSARTAAQARHPEIAARLGAGGVSALPTGTNPAPPEGAAAEPVDEPSGR